jgi:hypothetical protein
MLKLYVQDNSVYGMIVVVATSLLQAMELMKVHYNYDANHTIEEYEIEDGLCVVNFGDS